MLINTNRVNNSPGLEQPQECFILQFIVFIAHLNTKLNDENGLRSHLNF